MAGPAGDRPRRQAEPPRKVEQPVDPRPVHLRRRGVDAPVEVERDPPFRADPPAFLAQQRIEAFEGPIRLAAEFEAERDLAGDARHRMGAGVGLDDPGGDHQVLAGVEAAAPVVVERGEQPGGGEDGVAALRARHGPGMSGLAHAADPAVADVAADARDHGRRHVVLDQHRPLFDMQLDVAGDRRGVDQPAPAGDRGDVGSGPRHRLAERAAPFAVARREVVLRQPAEQSARADAGAPVPSAFLAAQRERLDVEHRPGAGLAHPDHRQQPGDDAGRAVVIAALGDRVEMRPAGQERRLVGAAGQRDRHVGGRVGGDLQAVAPRGLGDQGEGRVLARPVALARDAAPPGGGAAQLLEQLLGDRAAHAPASAPARAPSPR